MPSKQTDRSVVEYDKQMRSMTQASLREIFLKRAITPIMQPILAVEQEGSIPPSRLQNWTGELPPHPVPQCQEHLTLASLHDVDRGNADGERKDH